MCVGRGHKRCGESGLYRVLSSVGSQDCPPPPNPQALVQFPGTCIGMGRYYHCTPQTKRVRDTLGLLVLE